MCSHPFGTLSTQLQNRRVVVFFSEGRKGRGTPLRTFRCIMRRTESLKVPACVNKSMPFFPAISGSKQDCCLFLAGHGNSLSGGRLCSFLFFRGRALPLELAARGSSFKPQSLMLEAQQSWSSSLTQLPLEDAIPTCSVNILFIFIVWGTTI